MYIQVLDMPSNDIHQQRQATVKISNWIDKKRNKTFIPLHEKLGELHCPKKTHWFQRFAKMYQKFKKSGWIPIASIFTCVHGVQIDCDK